MEHNNGCEDYKKFSFDKFCPIDIIEDITVKVPVVVCAQAEVGNVEFECMGHSVEKRHKEHHEKHHKCDKFKVIQKIQVRIPLIFEAEVDVGDGHVEFELEA